MQRQIITVSLMSILASAAASGDFTGLSPEFVADAASDGFVVFRMYAGFDHPQDRVFTVSGVDIINYGAGPLWQAPPELGGGDTAPAAADAAMYPEVRWDTFVTIGVAVDEGYDATATAPDFTMGSCGPAGSWFDANPLTGAGSPDADGNVMVAQFTLRPEFMGVIEGVFDVFYESGETGEVVQATGYFISNTGELPLCPEDINNDHTIDGGDLAMLLGAWGSPGPGDLNCDGYVDGADLAQLLGAWTSNPHNCM